MEGASQKVKTCLGPSLWRTRHSSALEEGHVGFLVWAPYHNAAGSYCLGSVLGSLDPLFLQTDVRGIAFASFWLRKSSCMADCRASSSK